MNQYTVRLTDNALKQMKKMDMPTKKLIAKWIDDNLEGTDNPRRHGKQLSGPLKKYWRYRVGDYRIVADIRDDELTIVAVTIDHRRQVYRK